LEEVCGTGTAIPKLMIMIILDLQETSSLKLSQGKISIGDMDLGKAGITYKDRYIGDKFTSADRINEIEFNRLYNSAAALSGNEQLKRS
jgi:hypothetical protein